MPQAKTSPGAPAESPPPTEPVPGPADSGLFGAVSGFIDKSVSGIADSVKATGKAIGDATAPAREAAGAIVGLPSGLASGNERCAAAPNGAPDCRAAAETLCRAKGFQSGRSLDTQTRYCVPDTVGRGPLRPAECVFVTRALCQ